jgi:tetratricopeptide (TPR) repeat protein
VGLGAFHFTAGRYEEAKAAFREAARLSPDNPVPWSDLGGAQHMLGRFADAASSLQKSLEIAPNAVVYSNLGTAYFFQGLYPQAVSAFEKAVELSPNNATASRRSTGARSPVAVSSTSRIGPTPACERRPRGGPSRTGRPSPSRAGRFSSTSTRAASCRGTRA